MNKLTHHISALVLRGLLPVLFLLFLAGTAHGQTDAQLTQYWAVPTLYNPASAGSATPGNGPSDLIRIRGGARLQWLGIERAPKSFMATADMPFKFLNKRWGVGVIARQESAGLYTNLNVAAQLAYKLRRWGGEWSAGIQVGMYDQAFKGSEVYLPDGDDYHESTDEGIPTQDIHGMALDLAAGLRYTHKYFYASLGCTHLTSPKVKMQLPNSEGGSDTASDRYFEFQADRTLYFTLVGNIPIKNTLFEIMPSVMVKSDFTFTTGQADIRARYKKFLNFGVGYRWNDALTISLGAEIKNFYLGYSYDYATSAISKASSGSHELFLGYALKIDLSEKNRNKHKSIRIM